MSSTTNLDLITIVGTNYFQPIADLTENLFNKPEPRPFESRTSSMENGYSASLTVLLVAVLESFVARLRFLRNTEVIPGKSVPDLLVEFFPDLPNQEALIEVFLLRNIVVHNHVWHLDVSNVDESGIPTLATPKALKFQTSQNYDSVVNLITRRTRLLGLNASPTAVTRFDVGIVFNVVWDTLLFMNEKDFSHTPLAGQTVRFRGAFAQFGDLRTQFPVAPHAPSGLPLPPAKRER